MRNKFVEELKGGSAPDFDFQTERSKGQRGGDDDAD
jgi:hypothetical protein